MLSWANPFQFVDESNLNRRPYCAGIRGLLLKYHHFTNYGTDPSQHKPHSQTTQLFSSHISCTPITDLHHNRVRRYLDNESSRTAPVSRDGRISRRKLSPAL